MGVPDTFYSRFGKRILDVFAATVGLVVTSPVLAACAIAIKAEDGGPVFFVQRRSGKDNVDFDIYKLRSMVVDAEKINDGEDEDLITGVGRVLRRFSLDELPQLINILKGEMSFVGPRPTLPDQTARYTERQMGRLAVRPGITGLAQVRYRNDAPWSKRIDSDLEYVDKLSFLEDLKILLKTFSVVLGAEGQVLSDTTEASDDLG